MTAYEYTVLPAPDRGDKAKGAKTPAERFAVALTSELNRMAADGWEYIRAETLPTEERSGLTSRATVYHNVLIFRRAVEEVAIAPSEATAPPFSSPMRVTARPLAKDGKPADAAQDARPENAKPENV